MNPSEAGFKMPAEWSQHAGTLMEYPVREAMWPEPFEEIIDSFSEIVRTISRFEPVYLSVRPDLAGEVRKRFSGYNVNFFEIENDDSWARDNGPTIIKNKEGETAGIKWRFNAWGGKYPCRNDALVAGKVLKMLGIPALEIPIVLEGGSIHVDGEGTLLTTEECLLNKNRNPGLDKNSIEAVLMKNLGVEKVIWLRKGLYGDDTDGHVDNVACFAKPGVVMLQASSDPSSPNYEISRENEAILRNSKDAAGRQLEIIKIEQPPEAFYGELNLTLSYINFYFVNGGIILPQFGGEFSSYDKAARNVIAGTFPERKIVPVNGMPIIRGGGNVHCLTQQIPAGKPAVFNGGVK